MRYEVRIVQNRFTIWDTEADHGIGSFSADEEADCRSLCLLANNAPITRFPRMLMLIPKEKRKKNWPLECLESWVATLVRWEETGGSVSLSPSTMSGLRHAVEANVLYIKEMENALELRVTQSDEQDLLSN